MADTTAPSAPSVPVSSSPTSTSVVLTWPPVADDVVVKSYEVYNGASLLSTINSANAWTSRPLPAGGYWYALTYGNGQFVAVQSNTGKAATSPDGVIWTQRNTSNAGVFTSVAYGGGMYVAIPNTGTGAMSSPDGITWTNRTLPNSASWTSVAYGNGVFVAVASDNSAAYSTNGTTWTTTGINLATSAIAFGNGTFVSVQNNSTTVSTSTDGIHWTSRSNMPSASTWVSVDYGNGAFVAVAQNSSTLATSPDGITWTARTAALPSAATWVSVAYSSGAFLVISEAGSTASAVSLDNGVTWTAKTLPSASSWNAVRGVNGFFVAVSKTATTTVSATYDYSPTPTYQATISEGTNYAFSTKAKDAAGNPSAASPTLTYNTIPSTPANVQVTGVTVTTATLTWNAALDDLAVSSYSVYANGTLKVSGVGTTTTVLTGLTPNTAYSFTVVALDNNGQTSAQSLAATTSTPADVTAPSTPTNLKATSATASQIVLTWTASSDDAAVSAYDLRRDGTIVYTGAATTYTDTGRAAGTTYTYDVRAKDASGNTSPYSATLATNTSYSGSAITSFARGVTWGGATDNLLAVSETTTPFFAAFTRSGNTLTQITTPAMFGGPQVAGQQIAWTKDGQYLAIASTTSPYLGIYYYDSSANSVTRVASGSVPVPAAAVTAVAWDPTGTYLFVAVSATPFFVVYKKTGTGSSATFTNVAQSITQPTGTAVSLSITTFSGNKQFVALGASTQLLFYSFDTSTGLLADLQNISTSDQVQTCAWSPDGSLLALGTVSTNYLRLYSRTGNTLTSLGLPASQPASGLYGMSWSRDGSTLVMGSVGVPYQYAYTRNGTTLTATPSFFSNAASATAYGNAFGSSHLAVAENVSPFLQLDSIPAADTTAPTSAPVLSLQDVLASKVSLAWTASSDSSVTAYAVRRDGNVITIVQPGVTTYVDSAVTNTTYSYDVLALDQAGNSTASNAVSVTTSSDTSYSGLPGSVNAFDWRGRTYSGGQLTTVGSAVLAVAHVSTPFVTLLSRSGTTLSRLAVPAVPPASASDVVWSPDGTLLLVSSGSSPYWFMYYWDGSTLTKVTTALPSIFANTGLALSWTPDGAYVIAKGTAANTGFAVYTKSGSGLSATLALKAATPFTFTNGANATLQAANVSPDGAWVAFATSAAFTPVYPLSAGVPGTPQNLATTASVNSVSWSPDSQYFVTTNTVGGATKSITVFYKNAGTWTALAASNINTYPATAVNSSWSVDGSSFIVSSSTSPYTYEYVKTGSGASTTFTLKSSPSVQLQSGPGYVEYSTDYLAASPASTTTPFVALAGLSDTGVPTSPGQPTATNVAGTSVTLTWTAGTDNVGVTGYKVYGAPGGTITLGNVLTTDVTGLTSGSTYSFTVTALDASNNESPASTARSVTTTDTAAPSSPGQPTLSNQGETSVTLTWTAATDNIGVTGYKVYGAPGGTITLGNVLTTSVTGLTIGTPYSFTVTALDASNNESSASVARTYTPLDATPPSVPTGLSATAVSGSSVDLTWTASTDNIAVTGYEIRRGGSSIGTTSSTSFSDTGLSEITPYTYDVRARDAAGNWSGYSTTASATTLDVTAPSVPTGLTISGRTGTSISLSWTASTDNTGVTGYRVRRDNGAPVNVSGTSYTDTGLSDYTQYTYDVAARDAAGNWSGWSSTVSGYTLDTVPPTAPGQPSLSNQLETSVTLTWTAATDTVGVVAYQVLGAPGGTITLGNVLTTSVTGLTVGTPYTFTVKALDAAGNISPASSVRMYTPPDLTPPAIPTALSGVKTGNSIALSWNAVTDGEMYEVLRDGTSVGQTVGTTYTDIAPQDMSVYTVRARDAANNWSTPSNSYAVFVDTVPPATPGALQVDIFERKVSLTWDTDPDAMIYRIYRDGIQVATRTTGSFSETVPFADYDYTIRAQDTEGNLSDPSPVFTAKVAEDKSGVFREPLGDSTWSHESDDPGDEFRRLSRPGL